MSSWFIYKTDICEKFIFGTENVHSKNLDGFVFYVYLKRIDLLRFMFALERFFVDFKGLVATIMDKIFRSK